MNITNAPVTTCVGNVNDLWDTTTANWSILGVGGKKDRIIVGCGVTYMF